MELFVTPNLSKENYFPANKQGESHEISHDTIFFIYNTIRK